MPLIISKELRKKINKAAQDIINEEHKKKQLVNRNLDYEYLQTLINRCDVNGLVMKIILKDGTVIQMATQKHRDEYSDGYDGEPSVMELAELEIK